MADEVTTAKETAARVLRRLPVDRVLAIAGFDKDDPLAEEVRKTLTGDGVLAIISSEVTEALKGKTALEDKITRLEAEIKGVRDENDKLQSYADSRNKINHEILKRLHRAKSQRDAEVLKATKDLRALHDQQTHTIAELLVERGTLSKKLERFHPEEGGLLVRIGVDGNQFCAVFADSFEDLQQSPAGFGSSRTEALEDLLFQTTLEYPDGGEKAQEGNDNTDAADTASVDEAGSSDTGGEDTHPSQAEGAG